MSAPTWRGIESTFLLRARGDGLLLAETCATQRGEIVVRLGLRAVNQLGGTLDRAQAIALAIWVLECLQATDAEKRKYAQLGRDGRKRRGR